jgi:hypothetical protein
VTVDLDKIHGSNISSADYSGLTAHEGTHVADIKVNGSPTNRQEYKQGEERAFFTQAAVAMGLNSKSAYGLWNPSLDRDRAISQRDQAISDNAEQDTQIKCQNSPDFCK